MARSIDESKASNYLAKAENSLRMAKIALEEHAYDNAVMSAIHSAINAMDALCVLYLGKRASGVHSETLRIIKPILSTTEYSDTSKQFSSLLSMKNASEYQPDPMDKSEAEKSVVWAERILERIRQKMKNLEHK